MLLDNYAYLITDRASNLSVVVDPGDPEPVQVQAWVEYTVTLPSSRPFLQKFQIQNISFIMYCGSWIWDQWLNIHESV